MVKEYQSWPSKPPNPTHYVPAEHCNQSMTRAQWAHLVMDLTTIPTVINSLGRDSAGLHIKRLTHLPTTGVNKTPSHKNRLNRAKEMKMEIMKAHEQWKKRPADERFTSLEQMHNACIGHRSKAATASVGYDSLRVEADNGELMLVGKRTPAKLSHWSMGQLAQKAGAPSAYLRKLPATLAAQNINYGLKERATENTAAGDAQLLFRQDEDNGLVLRAALSKQYSRVWNAELTERLCSFQADNPQWINPPAYAIESPAKGDDWPTLSEGMVPSGLYASDHDMFAFLVDESRTLEGSPGGINRGFFVWNSEVGASSLGLMTFLYDKVCGNNIVWGASEVSEFKIRHVGDTRVRHSFAQMAIELRQYAESSATEVEAKIKSAKNYILGGTKLDALEAVLKIASKARIPELNFKKLNQAIEVAEKREERYGNPYSLWATVSGITEASQWEGQADNRMKMDRAAGKLLKVIDF